MISHDLGTARRIADFIAVLWKGRIVESGPSDELFNSRNEFVNQFLNAGGRAFGWYCLFVAITAIPAGIYTLQAADGNTALIWLAINWFAWAVLWALFWALLVLELPIARFTGWIAVLEGIGTAWALAIAVLEGKLSF